MVCFKGEGSKMNKKGKPCKKCNGTGTFGFKGLSEITKDIKEEIQNLCNSQFNGLFKEYIAKKEENQKVQTHG
jgi:hypothetical protein